MSLHSKFLFAKSVLIKYAINGNNPESKKNYKKYTNDVQWQSSGTGCENDITSMIISFVIVLILTKLYLTWWVAVTLVTPGHWSPPEPDTGHQGWPWHCQHSVVSLLSEKQFCLFEKISFQQCNNNSFECFVVSYLCLSENNSNPRKNTEAINQPSDI